MAGARRARMTTGRRADGEEGCNRPRHRRPMGRRGTTERPGCDSNPTPYPSPLGKGRGELRWHSATDGGDAAGEWTRREAGRRPRTGGARGGNGGKHGDGGKWRDWMMVN